MKKLRKILLILCLIAPLAMVAEDGNIIPISFKDKKGDDGRVKSAAYVPFTCLLTEEWLYVESTSSSLVEISIVNEDTREVEFSFISSSSHVEIPVMGMCGQFTIYLTQGNSTYYGNFSVF